MQHKQSCSVFAESFSHIQALLDAKNPQQLLTLQVALIQPPTERSAAYGRHVYTVAAEAGAEFSKAFEVELAEVKMAFADVVENLAKNAPAGTETAVAAFKGAVSASQNVIESAQSSAKKAVEVAESNFKAVANQAVNATTSASNKR